MAAQEKHRREKAIREGTDDIYNNLDAERDAIDMEIAAS